MMDLYETERLRIDLSLFDHGKIIERSRGIAELDAAHRYTGDCSGYTKRVPPLPLSFASSSSCKYSVPRSGPEP